MSMCSGSSAEALTASRQRNENVACLIERIRAGGMCPGRRTGRNQIDVLNPTGLVSAYKPTTRTVNDDIFHADTTATKHPTCAHFAYRNGIVCPLRVPINTEIEGHGIDGKHVLLLPTLYPESDNPKAISSS